MKLNVQNVLTEVDFTDFAIVDFEHTFEALTRTANTISDMANRPNQSLANGYSRPGADQMDCLVEWCWAERKRLVEFMRGHPYPDEDSERRRRLLLLTYEIEGGEALPEPLLAAA
jgi:hypothetical protein